MPARKHIAFIFFAFALLTTVVFGGALSSEYVSWDDPLLIVENSNVKKMNFTTIKNVFTSYDPELYIPLTFVSYQIEHLVGGGGPFVTHAVNLVLHTLNALLVTWLLFVLVGSGWIALAFGILFAVHPLNTEAVAWASARKDLLSTFFFFSSIIAYCYRTHGRKMFVISLFLFVLGLLSKVMVFTLPIVLLLIDEWQGRTRDGKMFLEKIPFFLLSIIFGIVGIFGKTGVLASSNLWQKILMACKSTVFYLSTFFFPVGLSVQYPFTKVISISLPEFFLPFVATAALLLLLLWLWSRRKTLAISLVFFFLTLLPTFINFSKGGDVYFASDRYMYIPMVGVLAFLGEVVRMYLGSSVGVLDAKRRMKKMALLFFVFFAAFSLRANVQTNTWKNSTTLYENVLKYYPTARAARNNLGMELLQKGEHDQAIEEFVLSLKTKDDPKIMVNLATAYAGKLQDDLAVLWLKKAIDIDPTIPDAYYGLGNIARRNGRFSEAVSLYKEALRFDPKYTNALNNLGATYVELGDWDGAIETFKKSVELHPDFPEAYYNMSGAYHSKGMLDEAEAGYRKALSLSPSNADILSSLAVLLYDKKDIDGAAKLLQQAFLTEYNNPIAEKLLLRMKKDGFAE